MLTLSRPTRRSLLAGIALSAIATPSFAGEGICCTATVSAIPQVQQFLSRLTSPTQAAVVRYTALITALISSGAWAKLDGFYAYNADTAANALLNMVSLNYPCVVNGSMTFAADVGFTGDGSTGYLNTGFTPSTAGGNYALGSSSLGVYIANGRASANTSEIIGAGANSFIAPLSTSNASIGSSEVTASPPSATNPNLNTNGYWVSTRTGASVEALYLNSASIATATQAQGALPANSIIIGAGGGSSSPANFSTDTVGFAWFGAGLTATDVLNIQSAIEVYKAAFIPAAVASAGYFSQALNDSWTSLADIDVNNTRAAGLKWYPAPYFGAEVPAASDFAIVNNRLVISAGTNASNYRSRLHSKGNTSSYFTGTIAGSVLTVLSMAGASVGINPIAAGQILAGPGITTGALSIVSQASGTAGGVGTYNLSAPATISSATEMVGQSGVGVTYAAGFYMQASFAWNPVNSPAFGAAGWPAWWTQDIAVLFAQNLTSGYSTAANGLEIDVFEALTTATPGVADPSVNFHDWTVTNGSGFGSESSVDNTSLAIGNPFFGIQHTYGMLWIKAANNGGIGKFQWFFDGVHYPAYDLSYMPGGTYSDGETGNFVLMFEGGYLDPMTILNVQLVH